jgi:hypothetical protein
VLILGKLAGIMCRSVPNLHAGLQQPETDPLVSGHTAGAGLWGESRSKGWAGARATTGAVSGKLYWEVTPQDSGLCRVGWATRAAAYDIGRDKRSFGFGATGTKSHGGQFLEYGARFGKVRACRATGRLLLRYSRPSVLASPVRHQLCAVDSVQAYTAGANLALHGCAP